VRARSEPVGRSAGRFAGFAGRDGVGGVSVDAGGSRRVEPHRRACGAAPSLRGGEGESHSDGGVARCPQCPHPLFLFCFFFFKDLKTAVTVSGVDSVDCRRCRRSAARLGCGCALGATRGQVGSSVDSSRAPGIRPHFAEVVHSAIPRCGCPRPQGRTPPSTACGRADLTPPSDARPDFSHRRPGRTRRRGQKSPAPAAPNRVPGDPDPHPVPAPLHPFDRLPRRPPRGLFWRPTGSDPGPPARRSEGSCGPSGVRPSGGSAAARGPVPDRRDVRPTPTPYSRAAGRDRTPPSERSAERDSAPDRIGRGH
jgi:hypothetical protein